MLNLRFFVNEMKTIKRNQFMNKVRYKRYDKENY